MALLGLWLQGKARIIEHGIVFPGLPESSNQSLWGSNFSVHRSDLAGVNGFNEEFEGWGHEDMELGVRLQFKGVRIRHLRNRVVQYHLDHDSLRRDNPKNDAILEHTKAARVIRTQKGLAEIREGDFSWKQYGAARDGAAV